MKCTDLRFSCWHFIGQVDNDPTKQIANATQGFRKVKKSQSADVKPASISFTEEKTKGWKNQQLNTAAVRSWQSYKGGNRLTRNEFGLEKVGTCKGLLTKYFKS